MNTSGQLIGINTAIASQTGVYQGYGFAVPSNLAIKVAKDLIEFGEVQRGLLGVSIAGVDYNRAVEKGMNTVRGVEILSVSEDGAAAESQIEPGDVVLRVNGVEVNEANQLQQQVAVLRPGETVNLDILRNGREMTKKVELKFQAPDEIPEISANEENIFPRDIPEEDRDGYKYREFDMGFRVEAIPTDESSEVFELYVDRVYKYTEAWNRGLQEGQEILKVGEQKVEDISTFGELMADELNKNGSVILEIRNKDNASGFIELKQN